MNEFAVSSIGYDYSVLTRSIGSGILEAVLIVGMLGFIIWNVRLALEKKKGD